MEYLQQLGRLVLDLSFLFPQRFRSHHRVEEALFPLHVARQLDVIQHGHALEEPDILKRPRHAKASDTRRLLFVNGLAVQLDRALIGSVHARDEIEDRRLPCSVRPYQPVKTSRRE